MLIGYIRFVTLFFFIGVFVAGAIVLRLLFGDTLRARRVAAQWLHVMCKIGLKTLGVKVEKIDVTGGIRSGMRGGEGHLIVANHLSYLDILVVASLRPMLFVTSNEIRDSGFLGYLAKAGGCHFVERRNRDQIQREVAEIAGSLSQGLSVVVFPEATSTNGAQVLPFKVALMDAAIVSGRPLLPLCLNYREIAGQPVGISNRDEICWYGDMTFLNHIINVARRGNIVVAVTKLHEVSVKPESDRKSLASEAYTQIVGHYVQIV
ncbi:MAG: 1-acyl-sn-glycerol-3-phosphate acyltransferase [Proteobacteria bacterium]|nr:1-acyl-sn-glycerol-3-phosphate acyltransferase [Pseudomonadota bacterium]